MRDTIESMKRQESNCKAMMLACDTCRREVRRRMLETRRIQRLAESCSNPAEVAVESRRRGFANSLLRV